MYRSPLIIDHLRPALATLLVLLLVAQLTACDSADAPPETASAEAPHDVETGSAAHVDIDPSDPDADKTHERLVVLNGPLTEIVFALGAGDQVVAVDESADYPPEVEDLTRLDYFRNISAEGVIAQRPDLILTSEGVGPDGVVDLWRDAGIDVVILDDPTTPDEAIARIEEIARILGAEDHLTHVLDPMQARLNEAAAQADKLHNLNTAQKPRVLMLYARGAGMVMVGGQNTGASEMITRAGGHIPVDFEGFRPVSTEGLVAARPDILLMTQKGLESLGGPENVWAIDGIAMTPAGQHQRLITVDDLPLLGYGPRMGDALLTMSEGFAQALNP